MGERKGLTRELLSYDAKNLPTTGGRNLVLLWGYFDEGKKDNAFKQINFEMTLGHSWIGVSSLKIRGTTISYLKYVHDSHEDRLLLKL